MDRLWTQPIAHRGLHGPGVPENSLAAFEGARRLGLAVELDVRVTADGRAVVHHDLDLLRLCGTDERIADLPLAQVVTRRLAGSDERVPSLAEALDLLGGEVPVLVDCKVRPTPRDRARMLDAVLPDLRGYGGPAGVVAFDPWLLAGLVEEAPGLLRGQSAGCSVNEARAPRLARGVAAPLDRFWLNLVSRPHFVTYNVDRLPQPALRRVREAGRPVLGWTVRDAADLARIAGAVDNVIAEGEAVGLLLARPALLAS